MGSPHPLISFVSRISGNKGAMATPKEACEAAVLAHLASADSIDSSTAFGSDKGFDAATVTSVLKSLLSDDFVSLASQDTTTWVLTEEAKGYVAKGMPEVQLFHLIPEEGIPMPQVAEICKANGFEAKVAQGALMKAKWAETVKTDKKDPGILKRKVDPSQVHTRRILPPPWGGRSGTNLDVLPAQ